jgi:RND family efflux transporter MFP subunit
MTARTVLSLAALLSLGILLPACDQQDDGPALPEPTGDRAPARKVIPTPAKAIAGETAYETNNHRWIGSVKAKHHVELAPGMTGVIASIAVEEGDTVEAGDKLFRIEGAEVKLAVSQAQAALASAELQLAEAERETERTRKLAERGSVGAANLERAEAGVKAAEAGVKQAKAAVSMARARTADLSVDSPISGIVTAKHKNVGEVATMMPPTIVLVIDDLSVVEVRVRVPELKLREVDVGTEVTVYFPALDIERRVPITRIGNSVDPHTRTIELILEVDNADLRIKSGMSVELALGSSIAAAAEADAKAKADANTDADADADPDPNADANEPPTTDKSAKTPTAMVTKPG